MKLNSFIGDHSKYEHISMKPCKLLLVTIGKYW